MSLTGRIARHLRRFSRDEGGVITVQSLFLTIACCAVGASAVDVNHFFAAQSQLQVSADLAAHAALYNRVRRHKSVDEARDLAVEAVRFGMPTAAYGDVIDPEDIEFGTWDAEAEEFDVNSSSRAAVMVTTHRVSASQNPVGSFFFRIVGLDQMDVATTSVFMQYQPGCLTQGFSSDGVVDVQSNGGYYNGFCMHSNSYVSINSNNYFENGTIVSMPDLSQLDIPSSGLETNDGLEEALHEDFYHLHILDRLASNGTDSLKTGILTPGSDYRPDYVTLTDVPNTTVSNNRAVTPADVQPNKVNTFTCSNTNRTITLQPASGAAEATFQNTVIMTNCNIAISGKVNLQDTVLYTSNISADSVKVNSGGGGDIGLWLGKADACATGGGAQIITRGGFKNSANLVMNGGQIIALGTVNFAAQATGVGASIVSRAGIDGSSHISMTGCDTGMEDNFKDPYFRAAY